MHFIVLHNYTIPKIVSHEGTKFFRYGNSQIEHKFFIFLIYKRAKRPKKTTKDQLSKGPKPDEKWQHGRICYYTNQTYLHSHKISNFVCRSPNYTKQSINKDYKRFDFCTKGLTNLSIKLLN